MLSINSDWQKNEDTKKKSEIIEYRRADFVGPFLTMCLEENENGTEKKVNPISSRVETIECSEDDFLLVSAAAREVFEKIGEFTLKTKLFEVKIDSGSTEEIITEALQKLTLF